MAEQRRVPFVSLSPIKPREAAGNLIVEQQQRNPPLLLAASQRPQQPRTQVQVMQQPRPLPQTSIQRPQREAATSSTTVKEAGTCHPRSSAKSEGDQASTEGTVRIELALADPTEETCAEFSYRVLLQNEQKGGQGQGVTSASDNAGQAKNPSNDPFNDDEQERLEVERMAKKFEAKYGRKSHRHRKDRVQDLIDIGYGYDETDPFIDNSEAYDELVPASLTTKYGGFYINTGTLQFRQASDSENEDFVENKKHKSTKTSKLKEDDRSLKKRKRKEDTLEKEKPSRKLKVTKQMGVMAFNAHKPDKKKKKMYKDSQSLAAMLQKFQKEKDAMRKNESRQNLPTLTVVSNPKPNPTPVANDLSDLALGNDQVLAIFGGGSERELLQEAECALEMLGDFDFDKLLDSASNDSPAPSDIGENGSVGQAANISQMQIPKQLPPLPEGLPAKLEKRIEDLQVAAKMFDEEGRKKFFTQEMNNILLDIELQLLELSPSSRSGVYGYIESFVPCTKDTLVKRLKKLHLHIQDDRLKEPLQRLKLAISNVMPGQLNRYQEDCQAHTQAKNAKHQGDDGERNPSEEDDEEKPGKRVMGPRKKFYWDDTIRNLLCNLVKIKLGCFELEPNKSQSAEDYLKTFMETEVKPLWPKGWMQSRLLFKESRSVHNHLTSALAKKKVIVAPKPKVKESSPKKEQKTSTPNSTVSRTPSLNEGGPISSVCTPNETICLDDSLDEDLSFKTPSLDSVSEALAVLNNGAVSSASSHTETPTSRPRVALREEKLASIMSKLPLGGPKKADPAQQTSSLIAGHSAPVPKKPQDLILTHSTVVSGLIAGSSIQNPKVSLEPLPAKLLQQGMQRSLQAEVSSSSTPAKVKASSASQTKASCAFSSASSSSTPAPLTSASYAHVSSSSSQIQNVSSLQTVKVHPPLQQNYVTPLQATISKSHTNPVVRLTSSPQISSTSPVMKTPEKTVAYRPSTSPSPGSNQPMSVSRTATSSTSTNFMAKNMGSQGSNPGFKSPYTMAPSPKPGTCPSSSSSSTPISQNTTHHKLTSGMNIGRPSPIANPMSSARGTMVIQGVRNPSTSPKTPSSSSKPVTSVIRQQSPSPKMFVSSPVQSPVPSPKLSNSSPKLQSQSPKLPNQPTKLSNPSPKSLNHSQPGTVKTTVPSSAQNVNRANQNSNVTNRTHHSGGAVSGALGATKQPIPHRQPSASGSPVAAATVQSAAASLLANTSPLTLMASPLSVTTPNVTSASLNPFSMLGGLVTMPFPFPLELLSFGSDTVGAVTSPGSTSAAIHNINQNFLKGLQTTATHTPTVSHSNLTPHLPQAFTDGGQSTGDTKLQRKNP